MGRRATLTYVGIVAVLASLLLTGCGPKPKHTEPTQAPSSATPTDVTEDESGPQSPIAYGFEVPIGASQIGPLIRYRSERLIQAYRPELQAAEAKRDADQMRKRDDAEGRGQPLPPEQPSPTPTSAPTNDTFRVLKAPPKPDTTVSLMRIDGSPTNVVRAMLAQIAVIVPKAKVVPTDLTKYCESKLRRVVHCHLTAEGKTPTGRDIAVTLDVDPGNVRTRTSPPASNQRPVMSLKVEYTGDPRAGQEDRRGDSNVNVPSRVKQRDRSGLIWPKMDLDARRSSRLLNDWKAPLSSDILLSGYHPAFVVLSTTRAVDASTIARKFAAAANPRVQPDVVEDLNEISTTYRAVAADGSQVFSTYVLSARGYYAVLMYTPPPTPVVPAPTVSVIRR